MPPDTWEEGRRGGTEAASYKVKGRGTPSVASGDSFSSADSVKAQDRRHRRLAPL